MRPGQFERKTHAPEGVHFGSDISHSGGLESLLGTLLPEWHVSAQARTVDHGIRKQNKARRPHETKQRIVSEQNNFAGSIPGY